MHSEPDVSVESTGGVEAHGDSGHRTAVQHMVTSFPTGSRAASVSDVREHLRGDNYELFDGIYVIDDQSHLLGIVPFSRLVAADDQQVLGGLMSREYSTVTPEVDQEQVAGLALERELTSVPVVDDKGRLLGVVPNAALLKILRHEHIEDMNRFVGIVKDGEQARHAIEGVAWHRVFHRLPWLLIGLVGSMAATWLMAGFQQTLEARIAVAFFVPAVVYLADAIGTQTEAVAVRGLSFSTASLATLLKGELWTGSLIGLVMGMMIFPMVLLVFGDPGLALAVSAAVLMAGTCATSVGLLLPWLLRRMGKDPAYGSGPVATILQDLLSLLTYFAMIWLFVS